MGVFKWLSGLGSLECLKAPFVCWQVVLPIFSGGIKLISLKIGSWTLIALVIISRFLLDFRSFLLEAIGVNSLKPLPF
jgi:hypothetical protein